MPTAPKQPPLPGAPEYQPYEVPGSDTSTPQNTAPPPAQVEPLPAPRYGFGRGAGGALGTAAFLASNVLRGYAQGKAISQAKRAMDAKRVADGLHGAYEMAAKNYYEIYKSRIDAGKKPSDPDFMTPELQQAAATKDATWAAMMKYVSAQVMGPAGEKKKKGKKDQSGQASADAQANPIAGLTSQDPVERAQAWLAMALKIGPDVDIQTKALASRAGMAETRYAAQRAENMAQVEDARKELNDLRLKDRSTMSPEDIKKDDARISQLEPIVASGGGATGTKYTAPRFGPTVTGADLVKMYPEGAPGPGGNFMPESGSTYKEVVYGEEGGKPLVRYEPMTVAGQLKTTAGVTGEPVQRVFNPYTKSWENEIGKVPQKAQFIKVKSRDSAGNPVELVVPFMPQYKHQFVPPPPGYTTDKPIDVGSESGEQVFSGEDIIPKAIAPVATDHPNAPQSTTTPTTTAPTTPAKPPAGTPRAKTLDDHLAQADQVAQESNVPSGIVSFPAYSKENQGAAKAIAGQELTINGMPGSDKDIGLRRSLDKVLNSPQDMENLGVAMQALDSFAKTQSSGVNSEEYGWVPFVKQTWSTIPAVQQAVGKLTPDGREYLTNFFRAWTNAATIRALQGTTGRPSQSMYAMLSNELPMPGINVRNKVDADRIVQSLQDDVDTAKGFLPKDMQDELDKKFPKSARTSTAPAAEHRHRPPGDAEDPQKVIDRLIQRHGTGATGGQPAGGPGLQ